MRLREVAMMGLLLVACGGKSGGGSDDGIVSEPEAEGATSSFQHALAVLTSKDLPKCEEAIESALVYVKAEKKFYTCSKTKWESIIVDKPGLEITSNKLINVVNANLCTSDDVCIFRGGQLVKYSDGSVLLMGSLSFLYADGSDSDSDHSSPSIMIPPKVPGGFVMLSDFVYRGSSYQSLYLYYDREKDEVTLRFDSNASNTLDVDDTVLYTLSLSNW